MFTGLVEEIGVLKDISRGKNSARLIIKAKLVLEDTALGDSVAVNGVCLTAVKIEKDFFEADVMAETLSKTNLNTLKIGDTVNLERALAFGSRMGGHLVTGHVDVVGVIKKKGKEGIAEIFTIRAPKDFMRYIIKKGSVSIDGISLTVVDFNSDSFKVSIIPHTLSMTVLGSKKCGDLVNLEGDVIGKYVERLLTVQEVNRAEPSGTGISVDRLGELGYL